MVKLELFKWLCMSLYDVALWNYCYVSVLTSSCHANTNVSKLVLFQNG